MFDYSQLYSLLERSPMRGWLEVLPQEIEHALLPANNGHLPTWIDALKRLPSIASKSVDLRSTAVTVGERSACDEGTRQRIETQLKELCPWRKGPYNIHGLLIDTEWRSDWKWNRLLPHIQPLKGRRVLDIGCGNGYHVWRMMGAGARWALGIDPYIAYVMQYWALRHFIKEVPAFVIPLGIEKLPFDDLSFETLFSMGVLYHRRSPFDHLMQLRKALVAGGELVLETLVIDGEQGDVLVPEGRYAKMRNVWFIPSCLTLESWLKRSGFKQVKRVSIERTTIQEQRSTPWMQFESLVDFLDPETPDKTIEGLPGPCRAIFVCQ